VKQLVRIAPLLLALFASTFSACGPTRPPRGLDNPNLVVGSLSQVNPLDIVVLPIQNNTGRANLPLTQLRQAFHAGMVRQKYSPLSLEFVDARVVEAAYTPGDLKEQAILQIFINKWDDTQWHSLARLHIEAEVYLLDSKQPDQRQPLWGGKVDRFIDLGREMQGLPNPNAAMTRAIQEFTDSVLGSLPARNPEKASP
jgi:hypothetical protein